MQTDEELKEHVRVYCMNHREEAAARQRKYCALNPEKSRARTAVRWEKYYILHPGGHTVAIAAWRKANPERVAIWVRKTNAKRRTLGFVPMNTCFEGSEAHHINQNDVIYIPKELHRSIWHNQWTGRGMEQINALAMAWLTSESTQ